MADYPGGIVITAGGEYTAPRDTTRLSKSEGLGTMPAMQFPSGAIRNWSDSLSGRDFAGGYST